MDMRDLLSILMVLATVGVSATAGAQDVYKSVNADGVVEYSDTPQPNSQEIEVKPNVVEVTPVSAPTPSPEASATEPEAQPEAASQPEELYGDANRNRKEEAVRQEVHHEAAAPANHGRANAGARARGR
jgi:hypothetical protein